MHAGLPRDDVIFSQAFYDDIIAAAPELELTIMAIPFRPRPLKDTRDALLQRLSLNLRQVRLLTQSQPHHLPCNARLDTYACTIRAIGRPALGYLTWFGLI